MYGLLFAGVLFHYLYTDSFIIAFMGENINRIMGDMANNVGFRSISAKRIKLDKFLGV